MEEKKRERKFYVYADACNDCGYKIFIAKQEEYLIKKGKFYVLIVARCSIGNGAQGIV